MLLGDGNQILDLLRRHCRQVADLPEPVRLRILLEHLDRQAHQLRDRVGAVVVAHDPTGDPGRTAAQPPLVDDHDVGTQRGQPPSGRKAIYAAADY